jgi:exodeoxyribonuclease VIII
MRDLMIDIETFGNGSNAVMIQLAGVFFDRKTGAIGNEFCESLDPVASKELGFETDQSTLDWWKKQDQKILKGILADTHHPKDVMEKFIRFIEYNVPSLQNVKVWSHATFDFPIVQNYLKKLTRNYLPYRGARDIRTLVDLSKINLDSYNWNAKTHDALDDCKFQIKYCVDAFNKINVK